MIETIINSYFKYINLPFTRRSFPRGLKFIYHCVLLTDLIQAIIFPTLSDLCIYSVFGDSVFISHISALHHMGATLGGLYWCLISYFNLTNVMYNTPLFSSVLTYLHLITDSAQQCLVIYARYYTYKGRMFHIIWHTSYYTIYSSMNVALTNLIVLSIKSMDKGGFIVHYNVLARIGHIVGPLLNILVTFLPPLKRSFFYFNSIKFENLEYVYILISVTCILRIYVSYVLKNEPRPTAMALYSNDIIKESGTYFQKDSANYSQGRYKYLPWTIFVMNTLTTFGSGLSISLMSIYMIKTFNIDYMYLWIGSLLIPVITTLLLFVLNSQQKKYGKLPTIFISKIIALGASFQNAPGPLKTSILLQCSNLESAGYWLSSEYLTRIIMAVTTVVGGQIVHMYGFHRCFLMTGENRNKSRPSALFYTISLLILLITMLVFPNV
ncbi:conserved hypothetical protein [Theileria orientalis strain Shintoku]|uniref:Uncharacterized protein n=1 Tax=Theileria orientalis strain Shintoku TaxID=869250 RepID=J4C2U4_THEOR|nr:conserved hypothetical protein [Theileria orientalis strain Shintoku]BAM39296.1 conserved hypothetical protein [Theileria orientalis strain Shintoku]|eukprot:XP_009689597.1 conserved hypothetical protein [Theileria orientalis strain Shintoku]